MQPLVAGLTPDVSFRVAYTRAEYVSIVSEIVTAQLARQRAAAGKPARPPGIFSRALMVAMLSAGFAYKKRKMPVCDFTINAQGIERITRTGTLTVPWSAVVAIHRCAQGYVVMKQNGGMPLPYRCFDAAQAPIVAALIERREGELMAAA